MNHRQIGDPAKLAAAVLMLADTEKPPMRFVAGGDALEFIETVILPKRHADVDTWRDLSNSLEVDN